MSFSACLDFGEDVELSGIEIDHTVLSRVTAVTNIAFPTGTVGKDYIYYGSGIDDALTIKVAIPEEKKEEFFSNPVFTEGKDEVPYIQLGKDKSWWNLDYLVDPTHRILDFPNGDMVEISIGEESGELIAYVSWITV